MATASIETYKLTLDVCNQLKMCSQWWSLAFRASYNLISQYHFLLEVFWKKLLLTIIDITNLQSSRKPLRIFSIMCMSQNKSEPRWSIYRSIALFSLLNNVRQSSKKYILQVVFFLQSLLLQSSYFIHNFCPTLYFVDLFLIWSYMYIIILVCLALLSLSSDSLMLMVSFENTIYNGSCFKELLIIINNPFLKLFSGWVQICCKRYKI